MTKNIGILPIIGIISIIMIIVLIRNYNVNELSKHTKHEETTIEKKIDKIPIEKNVKFVILANNKWIGYKLEKSSGNVYIDGVNINYLKMRWKTESNDTWTEGSSILGINNITILEFKLDGIKKVKVKLFQKN